MSVLPLLRRHAAVVLGAAVALVFVAEVLAKSDEPARLLWAAPLLGAVVAVRRRLPIPAVAVCAGAFEVIDRVEPAFNQDGGMAFLLAWLTTHYALGRWTSGSAAGLAPVLAVGSALVIGRDDIGSTVDTGDLAYFLTQSLLPWGVGLVTRIRQDHVARLQAENERLEREQAEMARRAVIEERSRIARELHDVVSHAISVTVLQSRGARRKLGRDEDAVREALDAIDRTNGAALSDMRRLLAVLRDTEDAEDPVVLRQPLPSLAQLDVLVAEVRASGLDVELTRGGVEQGVPPGVDLSAYRIVQEALTNVIKHAGPGADARVRLDFRPEDLLVTVRNTGGATDPDADSAASSGHGLVGIRERVAVVGGDVVMEQVAGGGFEIRARLPYALELS